MRIFKTALPLLMLATGVASSQTSPPARPASTPVENQAAGKALGDALTTSGGLTKSALSTLATTPGASNVWGTAYTGTADPALTGTATSPSMIGVGTTSINKTVAGFTGYTNVRADQADQAAVFLKKNPISKTTLSPTDALANTTRFNSSSATDLFASSTTKSCRQQSLTAKLDGNITYTCQETYDPYVIPCAKTKNVSFVKVPSCVSGQSLGGINQVPNGWEGFIDPNLVMTVTCASNGAGYSVTAFTSEDGVSPYMTLFTDISIPGQIGVSIGNTFISDVGIACSFPLYFSQSCDSANCTTHLKLIGSTCNGNDFDVANTNPIPMVDRLNESTSSSCAALEALAGP